jgi:orotate phosphoribosyltransferase
VFRLASGKMSRYYVDCKQALSDPEARALIGEITAGMINARDFDAVGGLELGAYPIAIAISDALYRLNGARLRVFVVRKEPKTHGIRDLIAGNVTEGDRALIVDDVVTTAASTIKAIRGERAAGLAVTQAIALLDREEENGAQNLAQEGVSFRPLLRLRDLTEFGK